MDDAHDAGIVVDLIEAAAKILTFTSGTNKAAFGTNPQLVSAVCFQGGYSR
jgi:hypothetical protein